VREIDDIEIGPPGEITRQMQQVYEDALHGRDERYTKWLDYIGTDSTDSASMPNPSRVASKA
nr:hypothetical protein [Thermoleophilaceae bacterium]